MPATTSPPTRTAAPTSPALVPVLWLALLATPTAVGANAPTLILPAMGDSLAVSTATATWLVTSFAWGMAVGTPLMAGLLRRQGAASTLRWGTGLVMAGTLTAGLAPWLPLLLAGRAAQALGGAGLVAVAMNLAGPPRRMGGISSGFGVLGACGPLAGELLASAVSWRLSLALSALSLIAVPAVLRHVRAAPLPQARAFDGRGAALLLAFASALVLLPTAPVPAVLAAIPAAALLTRQVRRRPDGFLPAVLVRSRSFLAAAGVALALSTSYFTLLFAVPRLMQDRSAWSTGAIGTGQLVALLTGAALSWLLAAASPRMSRPTVYVTLLGLGAVAAGTATTASSPALLLAAATFAVLAATGSNAILSGYAAQTAPVPQRPAAFGVFVLFYQLGGALGPAAASLLVPA
ncbi:Major Facilitator Superfamily protein [Streptomyces sp. YIM 130001]|uniref:MFS transporter n=1 Tax=Streptomyces sp. YIM 130001 TaxID=2259644 RepID=UPI000E6505B0|nr:MFS transporter [Streptomyces sp. YIM 130001]RII09285.1 Major Facilitator Superfamily protein [Streptomyces sp. YIM 130001]